MSDKGSRGEAVVPSPNSMPAVRAMLIWGLLRLVSLLLSQTVLDTVVALARKL